MKQVLYWITVYGANDIDSHNSEVTKPAVKALTLDHIKHHCVRRFNHDNQLEVKSWVGH